MKAGFRVSVMSLKSSEFVNLFVNPSLDSLWRIIFRLTLIFSFSQRRR